MKYLTDKHLYWLAWLFATLAVYFLASAFYISSQGLGNEKLNNKDNDSQVMKVKKQKILQGEEYSNKSMGC